MHSLANAALHTDGARAAGARPRLGAAGLAHRGWLWAALLILALVLVQTAGFVHQSAHMRLYPDGPRTSVRTAIRAASPVEAMLLQLVGDHGDSAQCLVYDQLSHGDCAPTASLDPLSATMPGGASALHAATTPRGTRLAQRARGPPVAG